MEDSTRNAGGLPPDGPAAPAALAEVLAEVLAAHGIAARLVEDALALHVAMPDTAAARGAMGPLVAQVGGIEASIVADLRAVLDGDLSPADVAAVVAHADRLYDLRPRLGRFVDRLLMSALARRAGLAAAA